VAGEAEQRLGDGATVSIVLFELLFVAAIALGFGIWQLWDVNRAIRRGRENKADSGDEEQGGS